jgi:hypothetical protein
MAFRTDVAPCYLMDMGNAPFYTNVFRSSGMPIFSMRLRGY